MRPTTTVLGVVALCAGAGCASREARAPNEARDSVEAMQARLGDAPVMVADPILDRNLLAQAEPDECFDRIGVAAGEMPCAAGEREKVNQTDIVSGVRSGNFAYFGTVANSTCIGADFLFGPLMPFETENIACEFGEGPLGDMRPPRILRLNTDTDEVEDLTPMDDPLLATTLGLKGAGAHDGVVLFAGPNIGAEGIDGLNVFAFDGDTGASLGSTTLTDWMGFGTGIVVKDVLYFGALGMDQPADIGGYVIKWKGHASDPFRFEIVGDLGSTPGSLVEHQGRIAVAGVNVPRSDGAIGELAGVYLSPVVPATGGLRRADKDGWTRILSIDDYEPDPVVARATCFGDLASFGGRLFVTTAQIPLDPTLKVFDAYGRPDTWWDRLFTHVHSERSAALLAIDQAGGDRQKTTLLYGSAVLPVYDASKGRIVGMPNNLDQEPLFGASGFGNPFVPIVTDMAVFDGRLYLGTLDESSAGPDLFGALAAPEALLDLPDDVVAVFDPMIQDAFDTYAGADLYRMDTAYSPVAAEDLAGAGNRYNSAFKVLLPFDDQLLVGTHNPFNLRTGATEPGGYELMSFTPMDR